MRVENSVTLIDMVQDGLNKTDEDCDPGQASSRSSDAQQEELDSDEATEVFPIVGIGASAGGLEAFRELLQALPTEPNCIFVLVQHLSPKHESLMADILDKATSLKVVEARDNYKLQLNHVYIIPPGAYIAIENDSIVLEEPVEHRGLRLPIDHFFRSLAESQGERAIAVVLTGTGSDGSQGVREIKAAGGLVVVQDPAEAPYDGMPRSAIRTNMVDFIEPIQKIAERIINFVRQPYLAREHGKGASAVAEEFEIQSIVSLIRAETEFDFTPYKRGTLERRIQRRMGLHQIKNVQEYLEKLREDPAEINALCKDLLITVTRFFRDQAAWDLIKEKIAELAVNAVNGGRELRIWCAGCATGEEAYSLAILVDEVSATFGQGINFQVFATDIDEDSINIARQGLYPKNIEQDVPKRYLQKYFSGEDDSYRVVKRLRERVVFAPQNVISDPPFSRLDLISCRNLLIYIAPEIQLRILSIFHFALKEAGVLVLGNSETLGRNGHLFSHISKELRIYRRVDRERRDQAEFLPFSRDKNTSEYVGAAPVQFRKKESMTEKARRILVSRYAPASVVVNADGDSQYFHGPVQRFLEIPAGEPTINVTDMAGAGLNLHIKNALRKAKQIRERISEEARRVRHNGRSINVRIEIDPINDPESAEPLFLLSFTDINDPEPQSQVSSGASSVDTVNIEQERSSDLVQQLEFELHATREDLQTSIEELETTNEELQSANEELETSREELQSLNEELVTVNSQLEDKVNELQRANDDITNLLSSVEIAVVFIGRDLRIRRFTEPAQDIFNIIETDIGRPIGDLVAKINDNNLTKAVQKVLKTLTPTSAEIPSKDSSRWFLRRIRPYRTGDDRIEGVVITYTDITSLKVSMKRLRKTEKQQRVIANLGQRALALDVVEPLFRMVCETLAEELGYDCNEILRYDDSRGDFELVAGSGWNGDLVGKGRTPADAESLAGYTYTHFAPVIVEDFDCEKRFRKQQILSDHQIRSGISCVIGQENDVWGVLAVHCKSPQQFTEEDVGFIQGIANLIYDGITRTQREASLAETVEILRLSLDAAEMGTWRWSVDSDSVTWDERTIQMFGRKDVKYDLDYETFYSSVHPDDQGRVGNSIGDTLDKDIPYQEEFRIIKPNGQVATIVTRGDILNLNGKRTLLGVNFDVTEQKALAHRYEIIAKELDHRVKNLLATVVSMARLMGTEVKSVEEFKELFQARMHSLANTQTLLSQFKWEGARLDDILDAELAPYMDGEHRNIEADGPPVMLGPNAAQCISMAIHELATNAMKYGALSAPAGCLNISWSIQRDEPEPVLNIKWLESRGPKVAEPERRGFGYKVVHELLVSQLRAEVNSDFAEDGYSCSIVIPIKGNIADSNDTSFIMIDNQPGSKSKPSDQKDLSEKTILVVDDEWFVSVALAETLRSTGANVPEPAVTLEQAKNLLENESVDLAVLDYNIAGRPVTPLARQLLGKDIPFLIVSGYGSGLQLPKDLQDVTILAKPIEDEALISHVQELLSSSSTSVS